ncbi:aminodeoxychorismate/anthranilate synthase component II [Mesobacillus maritimus]|uniref:anthranilate synthase component II n=1 Tax=Mesobacillus maritimus TaxID=1643336 RepID=UPI00203DEEE2|nr:aminodeoxychorismate/anthranilate synthase component II [Mesobacillus maritimus]MCM3585903.1 aminodeoxychorismate/anthranilate synthase component II [Mesobacillus maritimus]
MILLIDNYDSFTFNLFQYIRELGEDVVVKRNDQITIAEISKLNPSHILLSPGPGNPDSAGICLEVVQTFYQEIPIFGVCLGQQIIAQAFGCQIIKAKRPMHGKVSLIEHDNQGVFTGLSKPLQVARYHSLIVDEHTVPHSLEISARSTDGEIMALRHRAFPVEGVQFHPEAIQSEQGLDLLQNFFINQPAQQQKEKLNYDTTRTPIIV